MKKKKKFPRTVEMKKNGKKFQILLYFYFAQKIQESMAR